MTPALGGGCGHRRSFAGSPAGHAPAAHLCPAAQYWSGRGGWGALTYTLEVPPTQDEMLAEASPSALDSSTKLPKR